MTIPSLRALLAQQLGDPSGWFGRLLLRLLNRQNAPMNDLVLQSLQGRSMDSLLEIGFGGGDLLHKILTTKMPALVVGIERSPEAVALCQQRFPSFITTGKLKLLVAEAASLPFPAAQFHQICTVNTLYFWSDASQVIKECHRVLHSGGRLVLGYTSKTYLEQKKLDQHGFITYEVAEVEALLKNAGFVDIKTTSSRAKVNSSDREFFCTSGIVNAQKLD